MNITKSLIAAAVSLLAMGASAMPTATVGLSGGSFLTLVSPSATQPGPTNSGGTLQSGAVVVGTISGGAVLAGDYGYADTTAFGTPFGGTYLAAGPTVGTPAVLSLAPSTSFISFLWGSPDDYNSLLVTTTGGSFQFTAAGLGLSTDGNQSPTAAAYVGFTTGGLETITSLTFSSTQDAFEAANFSTSPIPEPETYALLLAGLGAMGFVARRREAARA